METVIEGSLDFANSAQRSVKLRNMNRVSRPHLFTQLSEPHSSLTASPSAFSFSFCCSPTTPTTVAAASRLSRNESARKKSARNCALEGTEPYSVSYVKEVTSLLPTQSSNSQLNRLCGGGTAGATTPDSALPATESPFVTCYDAKKSLFRFPPVTTPTSSLSQEKRQDEMYGKRRASLLPNTTNPTDDYGIGGSGDCATKSGACERTRAHNNANYDDMAIPACGGSVQYHRAGALLPGAPNALGTVSASLVSPSAAIRKISLERIGVQQTQQQQQQTQNNCRRKAVITVDAMTTEILIASDSVCRLFGLRDRSLIGKRLNEVFALEHAGAHIRRLSDGAQIYETLELSNSAGKNTTRRGMPVILGDEFLFDSVTHSLQPVYGKAVDILDVTGKRLTICVWSYPLTPVTKTPNYYNQRKTSAMILRCPSVIMGMGCGSGTAGKGGVDVETRSANTETTSTLTNSGALSTSTSQQEPTRKLITFTPNGDNANGNASGNGSWIEAGTALLNGSADQQKQQPRQDTVGTAAAAAGTSAKSVLNVLHEEHRNAEKNYRSQRENEKNVRAQKSDENRVHNNLANSYDHQRGSTCCASTSAVSISSSDTRKVEHTSEPTTGGQSREKMVESRLCAQSHAENDTTRDERDDANDELENRIIIKNGFKRTTMRVPQSCVLANASAAKRAAPATLNNGRGGDACAKNAPHSERNGNEHALVTAPATNNTVVEESPLNRRWLLLMEPINALHIAVLLGAKGRIFRMDDPLATILGYESTNRLFGTEISRLIPGLKIGAEWDGVKQFCCGKTTRLNGIPFTAVLQCDFDNDCNAYSYDLRIRSISSINGVVTITDNGMLYSYNVNFLEELFGHKIEAINKFNRKMDIKDLIPDFYKYQMATKPQNATTSASMREDDDDDFAAQRGVTKCNGFAKFELSFDGAQAEDDSAHEYSEPDDNADDDCASEREDVARVRHGATTTIASASLRVKPALSDYSLSARHSPATTNKGGTSLNCATESIAPLSRQRASSSGCSDAPSTSNGVASCDAFASHSICKSKRAGAKKNHSNDSGHSTGNGNVEEIVTGVYYGVVKHADNSLIPVKIEISEVCMPSQPRMFNVGIGFDRSNDYGISQLLSAELGGGDVPLHDAEEASRKSGTVPMDVPPPPAPIVAQLHKNKHPAYMATISSTSQLPTAGAGGATAADGDALSDLDAPKSAKFSIGSTFGALRECDSDSNIDILCPKTTGSDLECLTQSRAQPHDVSRHTLENENNDAVRGEYSKYYDTFQLIGNGAFGSVKLTARKSTGYLAVAKFVCKSKVLPESWVPSPKRGNRMVPIEVHLLENLHHANIVNVLDVFENDKYYQLVMEKLGCGMDLFEFIEFQPHLDEPLTSYIFRQIVSALDYLHENHIVHRDLKDENVIVDQNFSCKLIDFGSAAYFGENIVFSTFCGTMEYCSPEVLTGNKYLGPELEMWSLGILLYTLIFFENPFRNPQETVQAEFEIPWEISEGLYQVLNWLLLPDPRRRATVGEIKRHWWVTQRMDPNKYNFKEVIRDYDQGQLVPPRYISQLSDQNSVGNLSGLMITSPNSSAAANSDNACGTARTRRDKRDDDDDDANGADEEVPLASAPSTKKKSSTAALTIDTAFSSTVSPAMTPATGRVAASSCPVFTLNSINSDPTIVSLELDEDEVDRGHDNEEDGDAMIH